MVLKVVRGKILETLKLRRFSAQEKSGCLAKYRKQTTEILLPPVVEAKSWKHGSYGDSRSSAVQFLKPRMHIRLSKIADYLIDNLCVLMLSQLK
jgi:hypothetical protein